MDLFNGDPGEGHGIDPEEDQEVVDQEVDRE